MHAKPALKAVIFDLDGVLVNTSKYHAQAWIDLVRRLGYEPAADLEERVKGVSRMESLRIALGDAVGKYSAAELDALADEKNRNYLGLVVGLKPSDLLPGALELLEDLAQNGIKIVLGSASKNARPILDSLAITKYFNAIADGHAFKRSKPDPDVFLTAARLISAHPSECIVVEDAEAGVTAALAGGFVAVGTGTEASVKHAHLFVKSMKDLNTAKLRSLHASKCGKLP
jgi:beta-phosphoglucomutase